MAHGAFAAQPGPLSHERPRWTEQMPECRVLDAGEAAILAAIAAIQGLEPKQTISHIVARVDEQLAGACSRLLPAIRQGFAAIGRECQRHTGLDFQDLEEREQIRFVLSLRSGHKLTAFYSLIADQCRRAC